MPESKKNAVDRAIEEIKEEIRRYSIIYNRPDISGMNTILRDLPPEDFNELFRKLDEVAASELGRETYTLPLKFANQQEIPLEPNLVFRQQQMQTFGMIP